MTFIKECKTDFEKLKELAKSHSEVECTGRCYGCQAMCINRIPRLPEKTVTEVLSILEARKLALEIKEKLPEETVKELVSVLEAAKLALESKMNIEELRNFLNTVIEENPESKNQEVKIRCWDKDDLWDEGICDTAMSAEYHADEKVLIIEGAII